MTISLARIKSLYKSLPQTQRVLADYILSHPDEIPLASVQELARAAGVSQATISRFARAVGCRTLKDFKQQLAKRQRPSFEGIYRAIRPMDSDEAIIEKVFWGNIRSLEDTLVMVNRADLLAAAQALRSARRVLFFGIGGSSHVAADAALRFSQLDLAAEAAVDSYELLTRVIRLGKNDVAFGISHSGRSAITVQALTVARAARVTTIGLSNYLNSPLHAAATLFLCTSFPESGVKAAALSSRIAQLCILDALYLLVARHRQVPPRLLDELNGRTETLLRLR